MDLEARIKKTKDLLKDADALQDLFGKEKEVVEDSFQIVERFVEGEKKSGPELSGSEKDTLVKITELFLDYALERDITPFFRELSRSFLPLVDLFLKEEKERTGRRNIEATLALLSQNRTIEESFLVMKKLLAKARLFQEYEPPSFKLSREYLEALEDDQDSDK